MHTEYWVWVEDSMKKSSPTCDRWTIDTPDQEMNENPWFSNEDIINHAINSSSQAGNGVSNIRISTPQDLRWQNILEESEQLQL